jgi:hypothetical protein
MPVLSTRNKIRLQLEHAADDVDEVLYHLKHADDVAEGRHPRLSGFLPPLVEGLEQLKKILLDFREEI